LGPCTHAVDDEDNMCGQHGIQRALVIVATDALSNNNNSAHPDAQPQAETRAFPRSFDFSPELHQSDATTSHGYPTFRTQERHIRLAFITSKSLEVERCVHVPVHAGAASGRGIIVPYLPIPITPVRNICAFLRGHRSPCISFARNSCQLRNTLGV
jgi:hypothetical protein